MDPDTEFNALTALYQSVVHDMKASYPAWEIVGQRAQKLSTQLKATVASLAAFNDAVQTVSDLGNNLKGASRDVGACVTRVCMRQRAIESRLKAVADALSDELSVAIQQRTAFWKGRTNDLDKGAARHVKKIRSRKGRPDEGAVFEQRAICTQLLMEQRTQFAFFVNSILPVLNSEVVLLEEGLHVRPATESLESTLKHVDGENLVTTILSDLTQGAENAWRVCLATAGAAYSMSDEERRKMGSPNAYQNSHHRGPSSVDNDATPIARHGGSTIGDGQGTMTRTNGKAPLQRRTSNNSMATSSSPPDPVPPSMSSFRNSQNELRVQRPQSFTGELRSNYAAPASFANGFAASQSFHSSVLQSTAPVSSSCSSSDAASLIAETLHQIDQLGSDIEQFCSNEQMAPRVAGQGPKKMNGGEYASAEMIRQNGGTVRIRTDTSRPPPPERRSSTITAATPTAPSVAEARLSMHGSLMGSRQSLNSNPNSNAYAAQNGTNGTSYQPGGGGSGGGSPLPPPPPFPPTPTAAHPPPVYGNHFRPANVNPYSMQRAPPTHYT